MHARQVDRMILKPPRSISFTRAMDMLRRRGTCMIMQHHHGEPRHYIVPGGYVEQEIADKIKAHPQVSAGRDGIWNGMDQTWRIEPC